MLASKTQDSSKINQSAGEVLRLLRKRKKLTGAEFGRMTGLSQQQISRYERGINHLTLTMLIKMLIILDSSLEEFFYQLSILCGFADARDMLAVYDRQSTDAGSFTDEVCLLD